MSKKKNRDPNRAASHPDSNFVDKASIALIEYILASHGRVMPDLSSIDKKPNLDGTLDIQNANRQIIGKIDVQVKTLSENKLKYPCSRKFINYCKNRRDELVFLLCVDRQEKKIYWIHMNKVMLDSIPESESDTISLPMIEDQYFDENNKSYIDQWEKIVSEYNDKQDYYERNKKEIERLLSFADPVLGDSNSYFVKIHIFLDKLNLILDNELDVIKNIYYGNCWKVGLAYAKMDSKSITYVIYPIEIDKNDVQIKLLRADIDRDIQNRLNMQSSYTVISHIRQNPIFDKPIFYAYEFVNEIINDIIENNNFRSIKNYLLAKEYLISFMSRRNKKTIFHEQTYSVKEIEDVIQRGDFTVISYSGHRFIKIELINNLEVLKRANIKEISNMYKIGYSNDAIEANIRTLLGSIKEVYNTILEENFPIIKNDILLDISAIVIEYKVIDYDNYKVVNYDTLYLNGQIDTFNLYIGMNISNELMKSSNGYHTIEGKLYRRTRRISGQIDYFSTDTPLKNFVYDLLKDRLETYFEDRAARESID